MQRSQLLVLVFVVAVAGAFLLWGPGSADEAAPVIGPPVRVADERATPVAELQAEEAAHEERGPAVEPALSVPEPRATVARELDPVLARLSELKPEVFGEMTLAELEAVTNVDLRGADITDEDLYLIGQLTNLERLSLYGTPVTDAGLVHLAGLINLEFVVLRGTQVTGVGLQHLPTANLTDLHLCRSQVTVEDLQHTPVMPKLKTLKLNFLGFEDDLIEQLTVYPALKHIELDESSMSDSGLARLLELNPGLERIEMRNSKVSAAGMVALAKMYPGCNFVGGGNGQGPPLELHGMGK